MENLIQVSGKYVVLTPFLKSETQQVYQWRNSKDYIELCTNRRHIITYDQFLSELEYDFKYSRHEQYIIKRKSDLTPVGTIFSYGHNYHDGFIFITTFIEDQFKNSLFGVEAHLLMVYQLFSRLDNLFKVYCDVYSNNKNSLNIMKKSGYEVEGIFKNQKKNIDNSREDVIRLAIDLSKKDYVLDFISRIGNTVPKVEPFKNP